MNYLNQFDTRRSVAHRLLGHLGDIASVTHMPRFKNRMANLIKQSGAILSIHSEANLVGGESVGGAETSGAPVAATTDDDEGGGDSDPDGRPQTESSIFALPVLTVSPIFAFLFGGAK